MGPHLDPGALALAQEFGTRIVAFVSSVGDVDWPGDALAPDFAVTRGDVDNLGTLVILRPVATWHK